MTAVYVPPTRLPPLFTSFSSPDRADTRGKLRGHDPQLQPWAATIPELRMVLTIGELEILYASCRVGVTDASDRCSELEKTTYNKKPLFAIGWSLALAR